MKFQMNKPTLLKTLLCFAVIVLFWFLPPVEPLTVIGMRVIGTFIGTVLMLSLVDTVWPSILAVAILSQTGVASLNQAISGSFGSWIIYFVLMSFVMTHALTESGFTERLAIWFMSRKFASKSPWLFTFTLAALGMILGLFMDQIPATAFMLAFIAKIYQQLGYKPGDRYPMLMNIAAVFAVNIGGAMTPISHSLAILGMGIYEGVTGEAIGLFTYLIYGVPTGLVAAIILMILLRLFVKCDMEKVQNFDVRKLSENQKPMDLKEKTIVVIFFATAVMWMLPGILNMFASGSAFVQWLNSFGITFWAILSVSIMAIVRIDDKPLIDLRHVLNKEINWAVLLFIAIGVYLGSAVSSESVGLGALIQEKLTPLLNGLSPTVIVLLIALITCLLTNFASNVTTITVMTGVATTLALSTSAINPVAIALTTTMMGSCAFIMPSSFGTIAMLHGDEYSKPSMIIRYGLVAVAACVLAGTFVGYNICSMM